MKQKLKKHAKKKKSKGGMEKYHSMLLFPALLTTALIPFIVMAIKLLLIKGAVIGKIALVLMVISYFRRPSNGGGVHDHYMTDIMSEHYGYHKIDEPGIYVNK
ncbi:hypothetical protein GWI33_017461 [Rhynchophorus ferrugineus]|uniref:Uncharacterized protein n=1 Tax=Rhynchophorus ferrugineus TaxID=354439 RepID=A0A834M7M2_RHYFE|nr:hypothetical protein GWI33_017461 [Rhynchophorus ferrugineus]